MKNVLVIGGSYFAGRVFVEELLKRGGVNVHVFNRGRRPLGMPGVAEHVGDRDQPGSLAAVPPLAWDAVVDFCAYEPEQVRSLLRELPGTIGHYVFISTTTVYAPTSRLPVAEGAALLDGPQSELGEHGRYGFDKCRSELAAREECDGISVPWTIFRPAIIYGCYNYAPRESYFFDCLIDRRPVEFPKDSRSLFSFVWVVDMARALILALGQPEAFGQSFNLAAGELVSYRRIIDVLGEITGKPMAITEMSCDEIDRRGIPLPFPLTDHLVYDGRAAEQVLGLSYTPFLAGMRESLKYHLAVRRAARAGD